MVKKRAAISSAILAAIITCSFLYGCREKETGAEMNGGTSESTLVTISGSTSVGPLMEILAEGYKSENKNLSIEIQQIGSSAGIKNAETGVSQIGISSRDLRSDEAEHVTSEPIAYDGIVIITHKDNKVESLTIQQIKGIYTGRITHWNEVGGDDGKIVVVSREDGSGTRDSFQEIVGFTAGELEPKALIGDGNGSIKTTVMGNKNAIGYISFEYLDKAVKGLKCGGAAPDAENVVDDTYKLYRPFIIVYRKGSLSSEAQAFISYILSEEGQRIVSENGNIRIK